MCCGSGTVILVCTARVRRSATGCRRGVGYRSYVGRAASATCFPSVCVARSSAAHAYPARPGHASPTGSATLRPRDS